MKTYEELQNEQEKLNEELLKCPKCGVICAWGELIEQCECGACWEKGNERREDITNLNSLDK
jgi:hypothetical protein